MGDFWKALWPLECPGASGLPKGRMWGARGLGRRTPTFKTHARARPKLFSCAEGDRKLSFYRNKKHRSKGASLSSVVDGALYRGRYLSAVVLSSECRSCVMRAVVFSRLSGRQCGYLRCLSEPPPYFSSGFYPIGHFDLLLHMRTKAGFSLRF